MSHHVSHDVAVNPGAPLPHIDQESPHLIQGEKVVSGHGSSESVNKQGKKIHLGD